MISPRLSSSLPVFFVALIALGAGFLPASAHALQSALFLFCLVFTSGALGPILAPRLPRALSWVIGGIALLGAQSLFQTAWYYAGGLLGPLSDGLGGVFSILLLTIATSVLRPATPEEEKPTIIQTAEVTWSTLAILAFSSACIFLFISALDAATIRSINNPWALFPAGTFIAISSLFASGFLASIKSRKLIVCGLVALTLLIVASFTPLVYPLGYGFDGFLHRASEDVILQTGTLTPKPPSYIGQYTLVTWLVRVLHIPQGVGDVWLVGAFALVLPLTAWHLSSKKRGNFVLLCLPLALPLGIISATTPQNVAYILGLMSILWLVPREQETHEETGTSSRSIHPLIPWLFLAWSLATHPLAGLPFAFVGIALTFQSLRHTNLRRGITITSILGVLLAVPLAFTVRGALQGANMSWAWLKALPTVWTWFIGRLLEPATHLALWPDWANWQAYLLSFVLLGAALYAATRDSHRRGTWLTLIGFSFAANASSWLLQTSGDFSFLISYERLDYAGRLLVVAQLFLVPAAVIGMSFWFERAERAHPRMRAAALLLGIAWFSANVYNALPRHDAAMTGHGWSVGKSDLEAVHFIDKQANGQPYTVLANQTVSAAAIASFGFKRYVGDVFFYPIPTGGPLYERFLHMMDRPDLDIAREAGALGESSLVYVVVNNYWWRSEQVIEQLKVVADRTWNVERGAAYIFLFDLSTSSNASTTRSGT